MAFVNQDAFSSDPDLDAIIAQVYGEEDSDSDSDSGTITPTQASVSAFHSICDPT